MARLILLTLFSLTLSGCASMNPLNWFGDGDNVEPPAELHDLVNQIEPKTLWSQSVGSGSEDQHLKLIPSIADGKVFVADHAGLVTALDSATGKTIWTTETELEVSGGPGIGNSVVLLGTSNAELVALNIETGEQKWKSLVSSEVLSVPRAANGVVVVHTVDGKLFGFDELSGNQLWLYDRSTPVLTLHGSSSPVIAGDQVVCGLASGKLALLELSSGTPLWESTITAPSGRSELERMVDIDSDPLVVGDAVFVSTYQGDLAAVIRSTGAVAWRRELSAHTGLAAGRNHLYVSDSKDHVWAIDPRNSSAVWKNRSLKARRISGPAVVDGYVVVGDFEGYLHWLSPEDGAVIARTKLADAPIAAAPVVIDGVAYIYGASGELAAVTLSKP